MKILIVSQYFYPENFRINGLALELKNRGHDVDVLTGKPNYPKGEYYEGYSFKGDEDERWNGINIYRVPLRARHKGAVNLVRNYLSFVHNANKRICKLNKEYNLIYVFEVSPITVALPAIKLKKKRNIPVIMNVQDLWPENVVAVTGIDNPIVNGAIGKLVNHIYKYTDLILASSPAFISNIQNRVANKDKVVYWPQYSLVRKSTKKDDIKVFDNSKINVVFTGNIGEAQGLDLVVEATKKMRDDSVVFHLTGDGRKREELENAVKKNNLEKYVKFHGFVEEEKIPCILEEASYALLILKPNPVFDMTIPAKLQTYIACACPILACVKGVSKKIISEGDMGVCTDDVSVEGLINAVEKIKKIDSNRRKEMSLNALKYSNKYFEKSTLINKLESYMEGVCQISKVKH